MQRLHKYILPLLLVISAFGAGAARPVIKARLDTNILLMGKSTLLKVTVEQDKSVRGRYPLFEKIQENGIIPICGDSVELRMPSDVDTVEEGNNLKITFSIPVQSFDSGYYQLPGIALVNGVDTSYSNKTALKVVPVPNLTAETPIDDYANVADPENSSIFDALPDWLVDFWWLVLIILLAIALGIYILLRYRKNGYIIPPKPEPSPYETAMSALAALKEKKLWEQGMEKEYFTELTEILRVYLNRRFGINAMEMTSRQIMASLASNKDIKEKRSYVRQILDMADFVKFAKVRPLPADNIASYDNAVKFVEETKPVEPTEEEKAAALEEQKKGKKKKAKSVVSLKNNDKKSKGGAK